MSAVFDWRDLIRRPPPGRELKPTERLVALVLSFYMDQHTLENARPGTARLAAETGLSSRTVKAAMRSLIDSGWVAQTRKGGTRKGGTEKLASTYKGILPTSAERAPVQELHGSRGADVAPVPVQEIPFTGAAVAPHLALDLAQDLVCVSDIARSKLNLGKRNDTHAQETELEVKVAALVARHGEDGVREALEIIPAGSLPFAGDVIRTLQAALPDAAAAPRCERCNDTGQTNTGYPCGCSSTAGRRRYAVVER